MEYLIMITSHKSRWKFTARLACLALLINAGAASAALVITGTTTNNGGTAIPNWPVATNSLIAGMLPSSVGAGGFAQDYGGGTYGTIAGLPALTDGVLAPMGAGATAYGGQYATCGYDNGSGAYVIYTLSAAANGYNITNITTYTTWGDSAISQQKYAVSYSTVDNPTSFILLTFVNYAPGGSGGMANQVALTDSLGGAIAANVAAVKFDFTWPLSPYGVNAYDEITVQGTPAATLTPQPVVITTSNINNSSPFDPTTTWTVETPSLIAGMAPSALTGNPALGGGAGGGGTAVLTDGTLGTTGDSTTTASLGSGGGACSSLTYTLTNSVNGSDLTNIVTYSAWGDYGRDGQYYNVSYSTVYAPTTFIPLTSVAFNPYLVPLGTPSANRVGISSLTGVLAKNVYSVKFDFPQDNSIDYGSGAYQEIIVQGTDSVHTNVVPSPILVKDILPVYVQTFVGDQVVFTAAYSIVPPANLQWQQVTASPSATNYINTGVVTVTNAGVITSTLTLYNVQLTNSGSYTLKAVNATNGAAAPSYSTFAPLIVATNGLVPVRNILTTVSSQSSDGRGFVPTWPVAANSLLAGLSTTTEVGDFTQGGASSGTTVLTDGYIGPVSADTGWQSLFAAAGFNPSANAGQSLVYTLLPNAKGYNLTNITVYSGWADNTRDEQAYNVSYATVDNPSSFISLATVECNPSVPGSRPLGSTLAHHLTRTVILVTWKSRRKGRPPRQTLRRRLP